jgi:peptidyl-prolyl cis-trans isomerase A (cyclophilin A)
MMTRTILRSLLPTVVLAFTAASAQTTPTTPVTPPATSPATAPPTASDLPDSPGAATAPVVQITPTGPTAIFDTSMGRLTCKLFEKESPLAVANFIGLAEGTKEWTDPTNGQKVKGKSYYNGTTFHRVIPQFMIQGGDRKGDGSGDGGYYFQNENTPGLNFDVAGRLAMANAGADTNGTQFFITETPNTDLNGKYSIFGQCDSHTVLMVATIARVDRDRSDKPLSPVVLDKITIVREGQPIPPLPVPPIAAPAAATPPPGVPVAPHQ